MPLQRTEKIWFNGKWMNWTSASVHVLTHGLHYGTGVFEGIRCYDTAMGPAIFRLKEHIDRFFNSSRLILMKIPFKDHEIISAIRECVKKNMMKECYIRPIAFFGYGEMTVDTANSAVDVAIACWPWGAYLGEEGLENGIKVVTSRFRKGKGVLNDAKITGNYFKATIAKREAVSKGFDEALLLDSEGNVAEGSGENIFIVKDGEVITPSTGAILPGITRDSIIEIAKDLGYNVKEENITPDDLYSADEIFFTGTAAEVTPIRQVDNKIIGLGKRGKITEVLQKKFFEIVHGKDRAYHKWLVFV